jgi:hypothetical protein
MRVLAGVGQEFGRNQPCMKGVTGVNDGIAVARATVPTSMQRLPRPGVDRDAFGLGHIGQLTDEVRLGASVTTARYLRYFGTAKPASR